MNNFDYLKELGSEYLAHYGVKGMKWRNREKNVKEQDPRYKHLRAKKTEHGFKSLSSYKGNDGKWHGRYTVGFGKDRNNPTGEYKMHISTETLRDIVRSSNKKRYKKSVR